MRQTNFSFVARDDLVVKTKVGGSKEDVDEIFPLNQSEVLDFALVSSRLVIATNNAHMRVFHFDSGQMSVAHSPTGHTDAVLAVSALKPMLDKVPATTEDHFVSCGKDQSVCLWKFKGNACQLVGKGDNSFSVCKPGFFLDDCSVFLGLRSTPQQCHR